MESAKKKKKKGHGDKRRFIYSIFCEYPVAYNMPDPEYVLGVKIFKNLVPAFRKLTHGQINMVVAMVIGEQHSGSVKKEAAKFS